MKGWIMSQFGSGKLLFSNRDLKKLIIPLVIEQVLAISVGMFDTIMISRLGEAASSGVSLIDMINVLIINIFAALATGGAVVASQFIGAEKYSDAKKSASQLILVAFVVSVVIMVISLALKRQITSGVFGKLDADVLDSALTYIEITSLSFPFIAIYNCCAALFRAMGNSRVSMFVSTAMNIINIAGNAVLIFGFGMGVAGAAVATVLARFVSMLILLYLLCRGGNIIYISLRDCLKPDFAMIKRILHIGIPSCLENSLFQTGKLIVMRFIAMFGTVQIAANAVANNIAGIGCIPGQAMSLAMITVIGQCVGAGDYPQAKHFIKKIMKMTYIAAAAWNVFLILSLPLTLRLYDFSAETLTLGAVLILIHCISAIIFWPLAFTFPNALRASNDVTFTMAVSVISMALFRVVFSYILGVKLGMGAAGVWISMVIDWVCRCICFILRYKSGKWQKYKAEARPEMPTEDAAV